MLNFNIYIEDVHDRAKFIDSWPELDEIVINDPNGATRRHTVILNSKIKILDRKFFDEIHNLAAANNYLDALKHPAWMIFGNEFVKLNTGRDYWQLNLRPVLDFDDSTWCWND